MAITSSNVEASSETKTGSVSNRSGASGPVIVPGSLLISLTALAPDALQATLTNLALAFPGQAGANKIFVALPDAGDPALGNSSFPNLHLLPYSATTTSISEMFLTAADYLNAFKMAQDSRATACLVLGPESQSLSPDSIRAMAASVIGGATDLAVPRYDLGPNEGLVNSAILYPVSRALYGAKPRFPLAIDLGLSIRMAERLATVAQNFTSTGQNDSILWPVSEAATANYSIAEVEVGPRNLPHPSSIDLNALLAQIAGSLFADINAKATFWQRVRTLQPKRTVSQLREPAEGWPDVTPMLTTFRLGYANLQEIWSLVLPPNTLLGLKHLSVMPANAFRMSDALWTRIVYDFVLAYRLRTINRGHLMGALTPLYLAWVASHLILAGDGTAPEQHIEEVAATFENDKAYLVSRWRWPDRFNP